MRTSRLTVTTATVVFVVFMAFASAIPATLRAEDAPAKPAEQQPKADTPAPPAPATPAPAKDAAEAKPAEGKSSKPPFAVLLKDATKVSGLIPLWRKDDKVYAELTDSLLGKEFFVLISIARGIGDRFLLGGMSLGFGDDWVWQFRKVDDNIQVVRKNVRFFADKGSPEEKAVDLAYTDSVLFSLPIATTGPSGGHVIDLAPIFLSDLPQISRELPGFSFARDRSTWARVKGFPDNVELEVAATYGSSGSRDIDTVPDSRGATITVHYSLSLLPQNSYRPRLADDRVGYFVTALKDFSQKVDEDRFVRYINRWNLEKADSAAAVSPPKKPVVFWIEKTVPFTYRQAIREGIEVWNDAFEKAGFATAIEVRQQPDVTDWDPEDVNYNTFRWITAGASFAMGPSRVNPRTGQILDADIIFDGDFLRFWRTEYETFTPQSVALLTGGTPHGHGRQHSCDGCSLFDGHARETALAATALAAGAEGGLSDANKEKLVLQGLKLVAMHEVGHTLGLRHNFKGSAFRSLADINDVTKTATGGASTSVMDYIPVNIVPKGKTQGDYYTAKLGPYDMWAIEYGYRPISAGNPEAELPELDKIAGRSGEPALAYATDEETEFGDPDPLSNRFDLGSDPLEFAKSRAELVAQVMPLIADRMTAKEKDGRARGYERVRQAFGVLLAAHGQAMHTASRLVGGLHTSRSHKGDANAPSPFRVVEPQKQRDALALIEQQMFSAQPFTFPPELYNQLVATNWTHWGSNPPDREDYPVHDAILMWQSRVLGRLLNPLTLDRIRDSELKVPADQDAFTTAELLDRLTKSIMAEVDATAPGDYTVRKPAVGSLRRGLQRQYVSRLSSLAIAPSGVTPDAQAIAAAQLRSLEGRIGALLAKNDVKLDDYSRAHLGELQARIRKVLDASLELTSP
ncbi:MAG: zinc-dependent metalloprotease [Planctomycetia bacterium]|nr:zinc-dependent metalloprotease [Planctomycetia bacterium]